MNFFAKRQLVTFSALASTVLSLQAFASTDNVKIVGTLDGFVAPATHTMAANSTGYQGKPIVYQLIALSPEAKQWLATQASQPDTSPLTAMAYPYPPAKQLGMNDVPVLDQGRHGSCVTFAVTGVLDAAIGHTDHISQLCNLELGSALEKDNANHYSGWDGSWGDVVLNQIKDYGVISLASQHKIGCAGVYEYPTHDASNKGNPMSVTEFISRSERIMNQISFDTISTHADSFSHRAEPLGTLKKIKSALNKGHRVSFGTLLDVDVGHNGAMGTYKSPYDSWILTPKIRADVKAGKINAGHEMIITGYDDNAVIEGPDHIKEVGVLTLRNSWGEDAGDHGNYYMSYAHFKLMADEAYEIIPGSSH